MFEIMKPIITTFLSLILLTGNMGLTLAVHYCGGHATSSTVMLGQETMGCDMMESENECESSPHDSQAFAKDKCCEDLYQDLAVFSEHAPTIVQSINELNLNLILTYTLLDQQTVNSQSNKPCFNYTPPASKQDIPILIQSFLI